MCIQELVELGKEKYKHQYSTTPAPLPGKVTSEFILRVLFLVLSCITGLHVQKAVTSFGTIWWTHLGRKYPKKCMLLGHVSQWISQK